MADFDSIHQQVLGHLLGALDDDEQDWVESRLQHDEEYRRQWLEWRRRLLPLLALRPECEAPPGLAQRTCQFIEDCAPVPRRVKRRQRNMSPDAALPNRSAHAGWLDVAAVAVILLVGALLVPPAIHNSRFHSRLASCQEKLRQVGLALAQYGYDHVSPLSEYADNERLTDAGQFAAALLDAQLSADDGRAVCPEAWLAVQGDLHRSHFAALGLSGAQSPFSEPLEFGPPLPSGAPFELAGTANRDWLGTWRNGMVDGETESTPAAVALLADAPSADLPGQAYDCHDGQGRNMFFEDGHVDFLPCATPRDAVETLLTAGDDSPASPRVSVPITLVGMH
jgi:hypothetical protein